MAIQAKYRHVNIVARDWKKLADFYEKVFGCEKVPPERDHKGPWFDDVTGLSGANARGAHIRVPGWGDDGPTIEIFEYTPLDEGKTPAINRLGFAHIAFEVDDVEEALAALKEAGGGTLGKLIRSEVPGAGLLTVIYCTDPEGNIVELQKWG